MDIVEEFLELTRDVATNTLVSLCKVLRKRIPGKHLPSNLKQLCDLKSDPDHAATRFWRWLRKQSWRKMLPLAKEIDVVLLDRSRVEPHYIETWHVFLPSDMLLVKHLEN
ncbi:unnamed protein product [Durusdinium trenchii]|uniref:Uncharacterized protein n=1 Tax=Durusdinium trenchii TaxID=1381693 RepID=A0ABP0T1H8_9DINO